MKSESSEVVALTSFAQAASRFEPSHPYVEIVYAPLVGPSAILLVRSLARRLDAGDTTVDLGELGKELGLRSSSSEPFGARSPLRRALDRLAHLELVRVHDGALQVCSSVPPLPGRLLDRLPGRALDAHRRYVAELAS